jgi:hypothetical protein
MRNRWLRPSLPGRKRLSEFSRRQILFGGDFSPGIRLHVTQFGLIACSFPSQQLIHKMLTAPVLSDRFYLRHKSALRALAMLLWKYN